MDMTPEVASLLLRQHAALMEEGIGPGSWGRSSELDKGLDEGLLNEAWGLQGAAFGVCWGHEYGFVDKDDHDAACTCWGARCSRGEVAQCGVCDRFLHDDIPHRCGPSRTSWFVS